MKWCTSGAVAAALLVLAAGVAGAARASVITPVIIDTDMGDDDLAAIALLLEQEAEYRVLGICSSHGLTHVQAGAQSALRLLAYLGGEADGGRFSGVSVLQGLAAPLRGNHSFSDEVMRYSDDIPKLYGFPETSRSIDGDAVDFLVSQANAALGGVTIVALGPLTNIAGAILADPGFAGKVRHLYIMGGGIDITANGTPNNSSEWNMFIDYEAAGIVFNTSIPRTMVGLDATQYSLATKALAARIAAAGSSKMAQLLHKVVTAIVGFPDQDGHYLFDTTVPFVMRAERCGQSGAFKQETLPVSVSTVDPDTQGLTYCNEDAWCKTNVVMFLNGDLLDEWLVDMSKSRTHAV